MTKSTESSCPAPVSSLGRRLLYVMNDFTIQEHFCNLRCAYCLSNETRLKGVEPFTVTKPPDLARGSEGWQRAVRVLEAIRARSDAPILRFSGGECLAIPHAMDLVESAASRWSRLQVLTNATMLKGEILERLAAIPDINLCCSVDGHTPELNRFRTTHAKIAAGIVAGMLRAIHAGIPVEINMVLTRANTHAVRDFAAFLRDQNRTADVRLMPFPVRGQAATVERFGATVEQKGSLSRLLAEYDDFAEVLPPQTYLRDLLSFYEHGRRHRRCLIPLSFIQSFDDGGVASCSNCWSHLVGNVLEDGAALEQIGRAPIFRMLLRETPRAPMCRGCFSPFDVANAFFSGACSLDEIQRMHLYSAPQVARRLELLREQWKQAPAPAWTDTCGEGTDVK